MKAPFLRTFIFAIALSAGVAACRNGSETERAGIPDAPEQTGASVQDSLSTETAVSDTAATFEGTAGIVEKPFSIQGVATLQSVRTARHDGFDRTVFEFSQAGLPGYHLEYIDKPVRACGSGETVPLMGDGWLQVRMTPAVAHTEEGQPTVQDRQQAPRLPIVQELKLTCDFEADVTWVLGVASPNRYRVLELSGPPRLVVDVRH